MHLACCRPRWRISPSGGNWFHELNCKVAPGRSVWIDESKRRVLPQWAHPHCYAAFWDGLDSYVCKRCAWLLHTADCRCDKCFYTDGHISDEDDIRTPEIQEQEVS